MDTAATEKVTRMAFPDNELRCLIKENANLHGSAFGLVLFLVARGEIEPPTQGFSKQGSTGRAEAILAAPAK